MKEQAMEFIRNGNDKEIAFGRGMLLMIHEIESITEEDGEKMTDGECLDAIYNLINNKN